MEVIKQQFIDLKLENHCVFCFNGLELVTEVKKALDAKEDVDLILTDFMMPRLNGIQAVQQIQEHVYANNYHLEGSMSMPAFAFLTAYRTTAFNKYASDLGVNQVLEKPATIEQLQQILNEM